MTKHITTNTNIGFITRSPSRCEGSSYYLTIHITTYLQKKKKKHTTGLQRKDHIAGYAVTLIYTLGQSLLATNSICLSIIDKYPTTFLLYLANHQNTFFYILKCISGVTNHDVRLNAGNIVLSTHVPANHQRKGLRSKLHSWRSGDQ